jgi:molybdopterin-guanine dinucleotide biosynthesis protein A
MITLIPMAGSGSRFRAEGWTIPKPLLPMPDGSSLLLWIVARLWKCTSLVTAALERDRKALESRIQTVRNQYGLFSGAQVWLPRATSGPLQTVLQCRRWLRSSDELLIHYCDCFMRAGVSELVTQMSNSFADAGVVVFSSDDPRFRRDPDRKWAEGGIYWFRSGQQFLKHAQRLRGPGLGPGDVAWTMDYAIYPTDDYVDLGIPDAYRRFFAGYGKAVEAI